MNISILGAGAFAIALASIFHNNNHKIKIWTNSKEEKNYIIKIRKNNKIDYTIPKEITISTNMQETVKNTNLIVLAVPTKYIDYVSKELNKYYKDNQVICIASKGIEQNTHRFLYDIVKDNIQTNSLAVLSGGTFADDIIKEKPLGFTLAVKDNYAKKTILKSIQNNYIKIETTKDIIGTEICGSIKNIIAITAGIINGMGTTPSTNSMFLKEAINNITYLIKALGGNPKTILSYAGISDIILTSTSNKSRNYTLGTLIGENKSPKEINNYIKNNTIEGLYTLISIKELLEEKNINLPIINTTYDIIINKASPNELNKILITK